MGGWMAWMAWAYLVGFFLEKEGQPGIHAMISLNGLIV